MVKRKNYLLQAKTFYAVQNGIPDDPFFIDEACFDYYFNRLLYCLKAFRLQLHTYALLPHEVHLLVSPFSATGLITVLQKVSRDYGDYFDNRFSGACLLSQARPALLQLEGDNQVLAYQRSIELTPVRKQLVNMPGEYPWSGYRINAFGGHKDPIVMHHRYRNYCYGTERPFQRYRNFVAATSSPDSFRQGTEDCLGYSESESMS